MCGVCSIDFGILWYWFLSGPVLFWPMLAIWRTWQGVQAEIAGTIIVKSMRWSNCEGIEFILFLSWSDPIARGFLNSFPGCFRAEVLISCRWISCSEGGRAPYRNRREAGNHMKSLWVKLLYDELPNIRETVKEHEVWSPKATHKMWVSPHDSWEIRQ